MINRSRFVKTVQGTVSNTAISLETFGFDKNDVALADRVIISVTTGALRLTYDTAANPPTTTSGLKVPTNNYPFWVIEGRTNAQQLMMIRDASADATVTIIIESE